jgi:hypothetical protein
MDSSIEVRSFASSDEVNSPPNARVEAVVVGGQRVMRLTLAPGWHWGTDVRPGVGTDQCQARHLGVIISGAVEATHEDGTQKIYRAGDAYAIAPGHDARVLGDEVAVCFEFHGAWGEAN